MKTLGPPRPNYRAMGMFAAWKMFMGLYEIAGRLLIEVEGTIVSSQTTTGYRPVTYHLIQRSDGQLCKYVAGPTDLSLPRRMPAGTYIKKKKYEPSYVRDGKLVQDFPLPIYLAVLFGGMMLAWHSYSMSRLKWPPSIEELTLPRAKRH